MLHAAVVFAGFLLGALIPPLALVVLSLWYNNLGGAHRDPVTRNLITAFAVAAFGLGALNAAGESNAVLAAMGNQWVAITMTVVGTSVQVQDFEDTDGNAMRGRKTLPLIIGDVRARWITEVPIVVSSLICPIFWESGVLPFIFFFLEGLHLSWRVIVKRSLCEDKKSWRWWNLWAKTLYILSLAHRTVIC